MTQSKSRRLLYQQARLIRIQWAVILALVCTIVLMAIFLPKAKAVEETAAPTLELEPTSYATPEIMPEPTNFCNVNSNGNANNNNASNSNGVAFGFRLFPGETE